MRGAPTSRETWFGTRFGGEGPIPVCKLRVHFTIQSSVLRLSFLAYGDYSFDGSG